MLRKRRVIRSDDIGSPTQRRSGGIIIALLIIVIVSVSEWIVLNSTATFPPEARSYPYQFDQLGHIMVQGDTRFLPETRLIADDPGILGIRVNRDSTLDLIHYNSETVILAFEHNIGSGFEDESIDNITLDIDNDGYDELFAIRHSDYPWPRAVLGFLDMENEFVPIDTFEAPGAWTPFHSRWRLRAHVLRDNIIGNPLVLDDRVYVSIVGGRDNNKLRYLASYTREETPRRLTFHQTPINPIIGARIDPEWGGGIIVGGESLCTGTRGMDLAVPSIPDSISDCRSVIFRYSENGSLMWYKVLSEGGGITQVFSRQDTITAFSFAASFVKGDQSVYITRLNADDGTVYSRQQVSGELSDRRGYAESELGVGGIITSFTRLKKSFLVYEDCGHLLSEVEVPKQIQSPRSPSLVYYGENHAAIMYSCDGPSIILQDLYTGRVVARQPVTSINSMRPTRIRDQGEMSDLVAGIGRDALMLYRIRKSPLSWMILRIRWGLLILLFPPAIGAALWSTIHYFTLRQRSRRQLVRYSNQLRELSSLLRTSLEDERAKVARDIHDQLGQTLTVLRWNISSLGRIPRKQRNDLLGMVDELLADVRRISTELRPPVLDDLGLYAAIEWEAKRFSSRSNIETNLRLKARREPEDHELRTALYRIVQEALTNVLKHSQATRVNIITEEVNGRFILRVEDNGEGVRAQTSDPERPRLGLVGADERLRQFNGSVYIESTPGKGSALIVNVELPRDSNPSKA